MNKPKNVSLTTEFAEFYYFNSLVSLYKLHFLFLAVILAKAGIHYFQKDLDPRVRPEDDNFLIINTQTLLGYYSAFSVVNPFLKIKGCSA